MMERADLRELAKEETHLVQWQKVEEKLDR